MAQAHQYATAPPKTEKPAEVTATTMNLQPQGNAAMQEQLLAPPSAPAVGGPLGRMWNHILGRAEGTDTSGATASRDQIRSYLDGIGLAEGELFRGKKLSGVADELMKSYDSNRNGALSWAEFQGFASQLTNILSGPGGAAGEHKATDANKDGKANLDEIKDRTEGKLPKNTDYKDLIAQLGSRATIDAADTDQQKLPVSERTLSADEWTKAAGELGKK